MPGFNGMGPLSAGPMTGQGRGYCMSYVSPNTRFDQRPCLGSGRGQRHWYHATGMPGWVRWAPGVVPGTPVYVPPFNGEQELYFLKEQVECLEKALTQTKNRIKELENQD